MADRLLCTKRRQVWRHVCPQCDNDNTLAKPCGPDLEIHCLVCDTISYKDRE